MSNENERKGPCGGVRDVVKRRANGVKGFMREGVWQIDVDAQPFLKRTALQVVRFGTLVVNGFVRNRCALHAAGLTYFSILSVVPVLLLMLLLTKPCGMYEWSREKLRVQTDQMIETFFEKKGVAPADGVTAEGAVKPADAGAKPAEDRAKPVDAAKSAEDAKPAEAKPDGAAAGKEFGAQARQLRDQILGQIDTKIQDFNFGLMALVGFVVLAWTVIRTFGQVEASINEIWYVKKDRPIWRKAYLYVSAVMVLPLLTALAMSLPLLRVAKSVLDATLGATSYTKWAGDALIRVLDSSLFSFSVSLLFSALAIAFIFKAMPNRHVLNRAAIEGGLVTAVLLGVWVRLVAVLQFGISNSSAAYGSFALVPILIVWINMSWTILLFGSNMAYAFQCIHSRLRALPCD